ncbi:hypothetical protein BHM03_00055455 [Ensete ventricosum]|nr:hypothetical protein BHM03_00055455 [Ensete ventricosum]
MLLRHRGVSVEAEEGRRQDGRSHRSEPRDRLGLVLVREGERKGFVGVVGFSLPLLPPELHLWSRTSTAVGFDMRTTAVFSPRPSSAVLLHHAPPRCSTDCSFRNLMPIRFILCPRCLLISCSVSHSDLLIS